MSVRLTPNQNRLHNQQSRNIAEQVEVFFLHSKTFESMLSITNHITGADYWTGYITDYNEGVYIQLKGTKSCSVGFINYHGDLVRKPQNIDIISKYETSGHGTKIDYIIKK